MSVKFKVPSPSMAVSVAALVVAMSGTSYAAVSLKKNSVGSAQIKANAVTSAKVKDSSLLAKDFKAGELPRGAAGPAGPAGAAGPVGPAGARGPAGANGANGATNVKVRTKQIVVPAGTYNNQAVLCSTGERSTGGGAAFDGATPLPGDAIVESAPVIGDRFPAEGDTPNGWYAAVSNGSGGGPVTVNVYAICAAP